MQWTTYHAGQIVMCPGHRLDRREQERGPERRTAPRLAPCSQTHGRVTPGNVAHVRLMPRDEADRCQGEVPGLLVVRCAGARCHAFLELIVEPAASAAA